VRAARTTASAWRHLTHEVNRLWFETEEEFFTAASKCASLYFLPERRIFFADTSLFAQHDTAQQACWRACSAEADCACVERAQAYVLARARAFVLQS